MNRIIIVALIIIAVIVGSLLWRGGTFLPRADVETGSSCVDPDGIRAADVEFSPGPERSYDDQEIRFVCGRLVTLCSGTDAVLSIHDSGVLMMENSTENRSVIITDDLPAGSYEIRCTIGSYENTMMIERIERPADEVSPWGSVVAEPSRS